MNLVRNVTETTTIELHKCTKQDVEHLSAIVNINFDKLVNIALSSLLEDNKNFFHRDILKDALASLIEGDCSNASFVSPFINVDASYCEQGEIILIKADILGDNWNILDHSERQFKWNEHDELNLVLEELSFHIPMESECAIKYLQDRLSYLPCVKGGM